MLTDYKTYVVRHISGKFWNGYKYLSYFFPDPKTGHLSSSCWTTVPISKGDTRIEQFETLRSIYNRLRPIAKRIKRETDYVHPVPPSRYGRSTVHPLWAGLNLTDNEVWDLVFRDIEILEIDLSQINGTKIPFDDFKPKKMKVL